MCGWGSVGVMVSGCVLCEYGEDGADVLFGGQFLLFECGVGLLQFVSSIDDVFL